VADGWRELRAKRAPRSKMRRGWYALGGAAAGIVLAGLAPWPIAVTGPFVVAPAKSAVVVAPDSGMVFEVLVGEGSTVAAGDTLALIRNLGLEREAAAMARAVDSLALRETEARARGREGEAGRIAAQARAEAARAAGMRDRIRSLTVRAPEGGVVATSRPDTLLGRTVSLGDTLFRLAGSTEVEARIALEGAGASLARTGQPVRLIAHADRSFRLEAAVASVAVSASPGGGVESRVRLPGAEALRPGMTGEARITIRESTIWGALWWGIRRRIRTEVLL
jgi:multidrug efflux pump subunit AcrA (membrane-fusion protein)